MKFILVIAAFVFVLFFVLASGKVDGISISLGTTELHRECSPDTLDYGPFSPYCMAMVEYTYLLEKKCGLVIVNGENSLPDGYGYRQDLPAPCEKPELVEWNADSVTITRAGQPLSIPASSFTGGR